MHVVWNWRQSRKAREKLSCFRLKWYKIWRCFSQKYLNHVWMAWSQESSGGDFLLRGGGEMNMQYEFPLHKNGLFFAPKYQFYLKFGYILSPIVDFWHWKTPFWTILPLYLNIYLRVAQENLTFLTFELKMWFTKVSKGLFRNYWKLLSN